MWRKNLALLVYLALSPNASRSREHLLGLLWPEKPEPKARHSLNEAVRRLRAAMGAGRIVSKGDQIALITEGLEVDAVTERRSEHMRGEFLEGIYLDDAPEFESWVTQQRVKYRARTVDQLLRIGEDHLARDPREAREAARDVLATDQLSEPAVHLYMRAAALAGDTAAALAEFNAFTERLQDRIGEDPGRALVALAQRIRSGSWKGSIARRGEAEPALVGRDEVYRTSFESVVEGVHSGPVCVLVRAEPGMGRTRFVSACLERLALEGATVASTRPLESDTAAPWSLLRSLFQAGLKDAPGLAGTDPGSLGVLASVIPALAERFDPAEPHDSAHLASSLSATIASLADETPIAIGIDDAHYADAASLGAIYAMLTQLSAASVVVVMSAVVGDDVPRELLRLQSELGRGIKGTDVQLDPLSATEILALVESWDGIPPESRTDGRLARRIGYETGGSPFLAVELLRGLEKAESLRDDASMWPIPNQTLESPLPFSIPALVRRAITARIVDLESNARSVLCAASIGGQVLDIDLIASITGLDEAVVERGAEHLERHHFVDFDGDRYVFSAPVMADVVSHECMTRGEKRRLTKEAIVALNGRSDLDSVVLRAELRAAVDPGREAVEDAIEVARQGIELGSPRAAKRALAAAQRADADQSAAARIEQLRRKISG